ncbi:MAG: sulfotransferase [Rhodobacteraceae bacterium]|nr:sulfotransferase [Paracoccaceae bacterium]
MSPTQPAPGAPIFLICSERSGSNLASVIMGAHGGIYAHPPYHMGRDVLMKLHDALAGGPTGEAWALLRDNAVARVGQYRDAQEAQRLADWFAAQGRIDPCAIARFIWQQMPPEASGRRPFVKENNIHRLLPFLVSCFPDAQFLFQVRDPRDFLASAKARSNGRFGNKFGSLREALRVWRDDQEGGLAALSLLGPEKVTLLRYEDLLADPQAQLRRVCAFLGLDFDPAMLSFHETEAASRLAGTHDARQNVGRPLITDNAAKYRKNLSKSEIRTVETHLGDLMDRFGYESDYPRDSRRSAWRALKPCMTEAVERIVNKQLRARYKNDNTRLVDALDRVARPVPGMGQDGG